MPADLFVKFVDVAHEVAVDAVNGVAVTFTSVFVVPAAPAKLTKPLIAMNIKPQGKGVVCYLLKDIPFSPRNVSAIGGVASNKFYSRWWCYQTGYHCQG